MSRPRLCLYRLSLDPYMIKRVDRHQKQWSLTPIFFSPFLAEREVVVVGSGCPVFVLFAPFSFLGVYFLVPGLSCSPTPLLAAFFGSCLCYAVVNTKEKENKRRCLMSSSFLWNTRVRLPTSRGLDVRAGVRGGKEITNEDADLQFGGKGECHSGRFCIVW